MSDFTFEMSGLDALLANLNGLQERVRAEIPGALYEQAEEVMAESQKIVPVDLGTLKNSKFVEQPVSAGDSVSVTLGYGGEASDYAIVQHERLDFHHEVGEAKYLEKPVMALKATFLARMATTLKARLGI
jgi:hypothetical protein